MRVQDACTIELPSSDVPSGWPGLHRREAPEGEETLRSPAGHLSDRDHRDARRGLSQANKRRSRGQVIAVRESAVGKSLSALPVCLTDNVNVMLDLEAGYEEACRGFRESRSTI